jgi:hypothetical protein
MQHECEDCGDFVKRRVTCPLCKCLVCPNCYHHGHIGPLAGRPVNNAMQRTASPLKVARKSKPGASCRR